MRENFKYVNHLNEQIEFGNEPYLANYNDLRDYVLTYDKELIANFDRNNGAKKKLPLILIGATAQQKNNLYSIFQKDIDAEIPGTFWIGEYYAKGYIYGMANDDYLTDGQLSLTLSAVMTSDCWCKEVNVPFNAPTSSEVIAGRKNYPYGYPYGYNDAYSAQKVTNPFGTDCGFKLIIYGPATNPKVTIGGAVHGLNGSIVTGDYVIVTSRSKEKTITLHKNDGSSENWFNKRYKPESIFAKVPTGQSKVSPSTSFSFDLTLIDERSTPEWQN